MVQVQVPMFFRRQVLVKAMPGAKAVPSGTVTSVMNWARSQAAGGTVAILVGVGVGGVPVTVGVAVGGVMTPERAMMGLPHSPRSPAGEP